MADRMNDARLLRVGEIAGDFRGLQENIHALVTRDIATPPNAQSQALAGYVLLSQCAAEARRILAQQYQPGDLGIRPGQPVPATAALQQALRRIIFDICTRRFQAHKCYLRAAAGIRWVMARNNATTNPNGQREGLLRAADQRLREELTAITDTHVFNDLRRSDTTRGYWVAEEPTVEQILTWARTIQ